MSRYQRTITLAKASWAVLKSDRSLALFPIISALASLGLIVVVAVLGWFTKGKAVDVSTGHTQYTANVATYVIGAVTYLGLAFIQTYFLAGLVGSANEVLEGRSTTVGQGMNIASSRVSKLLPWAVMSATVSYVVQAIEQRFGLIGRIIGSVLGAAWSVLTFLTVPIIVFENVGPVTALKRSGTLLKSTWGENIIAQMGFGLLALVPMLVAVGIGFAGVASGTLVIAVPLVALAVVIFLATIVVVNALSGIFRTALYRYAVDGAVPGAFADVDLASAFGKKRGGLGN